MISQTIVNSINRFGIAEKHIGIMQEEVRAYVNEYSVCSQQPQKGEIRIHTVILGIVINTVYSIIAERDYGSECMPHKPRVATVLL